jgi:putative oxidoreductase
VATDPQESQPPPQRAFSSRRHDLIIVSRYVLRRLYSTFAAGWPGIGLPVMRLVVGAVLLEGTGPTLWSDPPLQMILTAAPLAISGRLLAAGPWTPVAGAVVAMIELLEILRVADHPLVSLRAGTMAAALAMLGPGRWSVDAPTLQMEAH